MKVSYVAFSSRMSIVCVTKTSGAQFVFVVSRTKVLGICCYVARLCTQFTSQFCHVVFTSSASGRIILTSAPEPS